MKKLALFTVILVILLTSIVISASAVTPTYGLYVGGVEVTEDNAPDVLGDGTVSYDAASATLTLTGADITTGYTIDMVDSPEVGIYSSASGLKIRLEGENRIAVGDPGDTDTSYAALSMGDLTIIGDGSLKIESGAGIAAISDITVRDCEMSFPTLGFTSMSGGLDISGATLYGAYSWAMGGDVTVKDSQILSGAQNGAGIGVGSGDITIDNSVIRSSSSEALACIEAAGGTIRIKSSSLDVTTNGPCILNEGGKLVVEDSSIKLNALGVEDAYAIEVSGGVEFKNTELDILSTGFGIFSNGGKIDFNGARGKINCTGTVAYAVYSAVGINLKDSELQVTSRSTSEIALGICSYASVNISNTRLKLDVRSGGKEAAIALGNMPEGGDVTVSSSEIEIYASGISAGGIQGDNVAISDSKTVITALADPSGEGAAFGVIANAGSVTVTHGALYVTATGPLEAQYVSTCVMTTNAVLYPSFIGADIKLIGNQAVSSFPTLSLYNNGYDVAAFTNVEGDNPIEYKKENVDMISYLHIYPYYRIEYNANGGTGEMLPEEQFYGELTIPECNFEAPEGKRFLGWALALDGELLTGETFTPMKDAILYAIWEDIPHEHSYGAEWKKDATSHWHECECTDKQDLGEHTDLDHNDVCDVCSFELPHVHYYPDLWRSDNESHWHECACGEKTDLAEHPDEGGDEICDVCEAEIVHVHSYGTDWQTDASSHWHECKCTDKAELAAHIDADYNSLCDVCSYELPPHVHSFGDWRQTDDGGHCKECACGEKQHVGAHVDSNENGTCDICGFGLDTLEAGGLGTGAIVGIVVGSVAVLGVGGFALVWFVIKKKSFGDLLAIFKKR
ncbi:MAG: hypothetical protein IKC32_04840 [Clostridia bacterium]|nr:hypothetical protein [Clostridia bacterium]